MQKQSIIANQPLSKEKAKTRVKFVAWAHIITYLLVLISIVSTNLSASVSGNLGLAAISGLLVLIGYFFLKHRPYSYAVFRAIHWIIAIIGSLLLIAASSWFATAINDLIVSNALFTGSLALLNVVYLALLPIISIIFLVVTKPKGIKDLF